VEESYDVRRATSADLQALVGLMGVFYAEAGFALNHGEASESFSTLLASEALGAVWIAYARSLPIGHTVLTVRYAMEHSGLCGYIDDLFVEPNHRRVGVASSLLKLLEAECIARNCRALVVEVGKDNAAGLRSYERMGMRHVNDGRVLYRKVL
jgi:ribosomal protein S18 acetylase RimI-like enzyme